MKLTQFGWTALALLGAVAQAPAQWNGWNETYSGRGTARINGRSYALDEARVDLADNGRFTIAFRGDRTAEFVFRGSWTDNRNDRISLRLTEGGSGNGTITLSGRRRIQAIDMRGNGSRYGDFNIRFVPTEGLFDEPGLSPGAMEIRGEGTLSIGGSTSRLRSVRIALHPGGKAEIDAIRTDGGRSSLYGRWFERRGNHVDLQIDDGLNSRDTEGRGSIQYDGRGRIHRVEIDGRTGARNFDLRFQSSGDGFFGGGGIGTGPFSDTRSGDGTIRVGSGTGDLDRASVTLRSNGRAEIRVSGSKSYTLEGRWREFGNSYMVTVEEGLGSSSTTGSGTITVSGGTFRSIHFSGSTGRERYSIDFTAGIAESGDRLRDGINQTRSGEGTVEYRDVRSPLDEATVDLNSDGTFTVRVWGRSDWRYRGTWNPTGNDAALRIQSGGRNGSAVGSGVVRIRDGRFWRVEMDVREGGTSYRIRFQVN